MAEYLARGTIGEVVSAGTQAVADRAMHPKAITALAEEGIDASGFRSRALTCELVTDATLVLTATREQRAACVRMTPSRLGRVFTLRQFSRLVDASGLKQPTDVDTVLEAITEARGTIQPVPQPQDEIVDPQHGTLDDMRACLQLIQRSLEPVLSVIRLP